MGVCKCSVCKLVTGNYKLSCGLCRPANSADSRPTLLRRTSVDSSIRSDYDGSCVTRHFADIERSIPSESVRTSANDNWRSVDDNTYR